MWWRKAKVEEKEEDYIDQICRSLVERPYEWMHTLSSIIGTEDKVNKLIHISGVKVSYATGIVWMCPNDVQMQGTIMSSAVRVKINKAIEGHMASLVTRKQYRFSDSALALAKAVEAGDEIAVYALVDEINEHRSNSSPEDK